MGLLAAAGQAGMKQNDAAATVYFQAAARQGDPAGAHHLGRAYSRGRGVEQNDGLAATFYRQAAGNYPRAAYELGVLYAAGRGVTQDAAQGLFWYRMAAYSGDGDAMQAIADAYHNGTGVAKDEQQSAEWARKAAAAKTKSTRSSPP
jgi:TPR repeat protein